MIQKFGNFDNRYAEENIFDNVLLKLLIATFQ